MDHWKDVGYELIKGKYEEGQKVIIRRNPENSPLSISKYQSKNEIIKTFIASSMDEEIENIIHEIQYFIDQGLRPSDIMVISLDDRHAKSYFRKISFKLSDLNILTNNVLSSSSENPPFILDNMITLTTVHRAKGNEAACVFVLGIDSLYSVKRLRQTRNRIFTAFTRTKAWLRISGVGSGANHFKNEIDMSLDKSPNLEFTVPNKETLEHIQRDLSEKEQLKINFRDEVNKLKGNGLSIDEIEEEMQRLLGGYDND